jgi:hypothetical protein
MVHTEKGFANIYVHINYRTYEPSNKFMIDFICWYTSGRDPKTWQYHHREGYLFGFQLRPE